MLQLRNVLQLVIDGFYHGPLAEQHLVGHAHQAVLHVVPHLGDELDAIDEQLMEEFLGYVALVADQFSVDFPHEVLYLQRLPVVDIRRGDHETQHFALLVDDEMHLEAEEPSHGALAPHGDALEHLVAVDALVAADAHRRGVDEVDARALAQQHLLDEDQQRQGHFPLQFHEPVVRHGLGEEVAPVLAHIPKVKVLQATVPFHVEGYEDGHHLGIRHAVGLVAVALPVAHLKGVPSYRLVEKLAEIVCHAINFRNFAV